MWLGIYNEIKSFKFKFPFHSVLGFFLVELNNNNKKVNMVSSPFLKKKLK